MHGMRSTRINFPQFHGLTCLRGFGVQNAQARETPLHWSKHARDAVNREAGQPRGKHADVERGAKEGKIKRYREACAAEKREGCSEGD